MFSKTLIKLIDQAIFPAVLIISAKIIGVVFFIKYFDASFSSSGTQLIFSNLNDFIAVNSYSSLFMFIAVLSGLVWVVVKAHVFHDTHIKPSLSARMFELSMDDLIHTNEVIFSQAFIWLSYAWMTTIMFGIHAYFELSYWWVFFVALGVSIIATAALAIDVEREIISDKKNIEPEDGKEVLSFKQIREEFFQ